jgi:hypothetical protein
MTTHTLEPIGTHPTDYGAMLRWAADVAASTDVAAVLPVVAQRSWIKLSTSAGWDAWLIAWPSGAHTGWHDHQGAAGVFYVARGALTEFSLAGRTSGGVSAGAVVASWQDVRTRRVVAGKGRALGSGHVHHVVNEHDEPAYSVHVYSPRLRAMTRYSWRDDALISTGVEAAGDW